MLAKLTLPGEVSSVRTHLNSLLIGLLFTVRLVFPVHPSSLYIPKSQILLSPSQRNSLVSAELGWGVSSITLEIMFKYTSDYNL